MSDDLILLFDKLLLDIDGVEVSQPLAIGSANQIQIHAWIESTGSATTLSSNPVVLQLQVSHDMDNWQNKSGLAVTLSFAPSAGAANTYGSSDQLAHPYIRFKAEGGGVAALVSAGVRLFHS